MLANFTEKISKLLNPTNFMPTGDVGKGTDLNQLMDGGKACSLTPVTLSNAGESTGQEITEVKATFFFSFKSELKLQERDRHWDSICPVGAQSVLGHTLDPRLANN